MWMTLLGLLLGGFVTAWIMAIITGNIVENAHIMNNDSDDCVIENNIGDVL